MSQKQQYDEAEQQRLYHDSIRSYWTPERIRNAKVKDVHEESIPGKKQQAFGLQANVPATAVLDETRKTLPYKNVGKIFFNQGTVDYCGTAYVVDTDKGKNIVFTAAHNLYDDDGKSENITFIPAYQSDKKAVPDFGQFTQLKEDSWVVSSNWVPKTNPRQYDIGAIKLGKNSKGKEVGEVLPGFKIETKPDAQQSGYVKDQTEWKIIGYGKNVMYESDGVFIELEKRSKDNVDGYVVKRTNPLLVGMSGGPWLPKDALDKANGNESGSGSNCAISPFYAKKTVDDILSKLSNL